jgi:hypothetical protein
MAKDEPQKPQAAAPALGEQPITRDELFTLVQALVANQSLTADKVREIATQATLDAYDKTSGKNWDIKNYPKISQFNPLGEKDHPRDRLVGEVFWLGFKLSEAELTQGEIALINQIEPGLYGPDGTWVVKDMQPGTTDRSKRKLLVIFPNKDEDARSRLPQGDLWSGKTGVEQMCEVMIGMRVVPAGA